MDPVGDIFVYDNLGIRRISNMTGLIDGYIGGGSNLGTLGFGLIDSMIIRSGTYEQ